ncbi:MAG: hypothetical protein Q7S33_04400 [Nanoarchaeota archaeon]|nr:hypothetical protein [Nanoarchaeota archaeon]
MLKERAKKLSIIDIQLIKLAVFFFAFWIASYFPNEIIMQYRWLWFGLFIVSSIKPLWKFFNK